MSLENSDLKTKITDLEGRLNFVKLIFKKSKKSEVSEKSGEIAVCDSRHSKVQQGLGFKLCQEDLDHAVRLRPK